ncbi:protein JTB-like [Gigantopelta aegis]|uniref:protein JTB-like n=1 Tax=Gigantopelta aegis TaxID=1735272 RepID=UPI001B8875AC|nr:protein JTB-like [Gigantopelta aegis]
MVECCTKKRMIAAVITLISLSVLTLVLENKWSFEHKVKEAQMSSDVNANESCSSDKFTELDSCKKCSRKELRKLLPFCMETGYKQLVECDNGKKLFRQCMITADIEARSFWIFEAVNIILAVSSYTFVHFRRRKLDKLMMDKINRQIGDGV